MAKDKILITGSDGRIGQALAGLGSAYEIVPYDLPEYDATNYNQLVAKLAGCRALVHLAFDLSREYSKTGKIGNPANRQMGHTALAAAVEVGVERCIMGSSVNAARDTGYNNHSYRTTKLQLEQAAADYAYQYPDIGFTSVRFGRVKGDGNQPPEVIERPDQTWISNRDACNLVTAIIETPHEPGKHEIVYGVSNREDMPYPIDNPFGWQPQDWFGGGPAHA